MEPSQATCPDCSRTLEPGDNFCGRCGRRLTSPSPATNEAEREVSPTWTEERKLATVLFGDIAGFTRVSSRLEPDEVWTFANTLFGPLSQEVELRGGTVLKYIGDSIMAVFGVPRSNEDDAVRAVEAALAMRARLNDLSAEVEARYGAAINMRIGINTGLLMVGTVGLGSNLDVMGTTVNVASRVEGLGRPGEVLVTEQTHRAIQKAFDCESMGLIHVKGIDEPLGVHRVLGERTTAIRATAPRAEETFLRQPELQTLTAALDAVCQSGRLRVVKIVGETGMGKNRLLAELDRAAADRSLRAIRVGAGSTAFASTGSLALIGRVVRHAVGVRANEPVAAARARVIDDLVSAWPPGAREKAETAAALLADAAAVRSRSSSHDAFGPGTHQHDSHLAAFSEWIENLAHPRPLLIVLEDLEASDEISLTLIERLLRGAGDLPALVVLSYQPQLEDQRLGWLDDLPEVDRVELAALDPGILRTLVDALLCDVTGMPEDVKDEIVRRSEGRPQYAVEIVRLLRDRAVVTRAEDDSEERWNAERFQQIDLPETVLGLVQARMDALPTLEKEVLKRASVVGQSFWRGSLEHLFADERSPGEIDAALSALISAALLHAKPGSSLGGEQEYEFRSQALRDVAYRSLPTTPRQRWHRRIARWVESQGDLWEGGQAAIAAHLEAGGVPDQALEHYLSAARHALLLYDARRAAELYEKALSVWPDAFEPIERAIARRERASALTLVGRFDEASEALSRAVAEFDDAGVPDDAESRAWTDLTLAYLQKTTGELEASLRTFDQAAARVEDRPPSVVQMWILGQRASQRLAGNDLEGARSDCERGLHVSDRLDARDDAWRHGRWMLVNVLGNILLRTGRLDEAEGRYREALDVVGSASNPRGRYVAHVSIGAIAFERKRLEEATQSFEAALQLSRKFGWRKDEAISLNNLGQTHLAAGRLDEATSMLGEAIHAAAASRLLDVLADGGRALAETLLRRNRPQEALAEARSAIDAAQRGGHPRFEGEAHAVATECLMAGAAPPEGADVGAETEAHYRSAEALLAKIGLDDRLETLRRRFQAANAQGVAG